ncbi:MAG: UDP-N-acetylmuramoyl-L-alanine--D-glutamate ligase [Candidatus Nomurabacteria bacterium]|jgi:UDP-N-acetylmuramoylalanine--D-glutamate ligase|nr:UDP-N-acetylmuramoyl-L-alanine--D-glutamate ligase [Candidatus Nomurabacteria bacterium]
MNIAIAGYGVEGKANYEYYKKQSYTEQIIIYDERTDVKAPKGVKAVLGPNALSKIPDDFMVIRTNGLAPGKIKSGGKVWTGTNEFFVKCPAPIIGVSGTKGKGTTASFITEILRAAGRKVFLLGNIGVAALSELPKIREDDIVVFEMSSFQLWDAVYSPHVAVLTMIEPDHLNVHNDFADYTRAKANIAKYQSVDDTVVYHARDKNTKAIANLSQGTKLPFPSLRSVHIKKGAFYWRTRRLCATSVVKLPGRHNLRNAMAAIGATYGFINGDKKAIAAGLGNFAGLPHRLQFVANVGGVSYYDDSIATTPGSAIAAISSFSQPIILITGGADKGVDYDTLAREISTHNVRDVLVIGANRKKIMADLHRHKCKNIHEVSSEKMSDIVGYAYELAEPGDVVILSPAAASLDMFKSYADRGDQFAWAVRNLG